jgi:ArsR family transcriptional regulator
MKENAYRQAAGLFQLLSHPARLCILDELRRGEACVCHLQTVMGRPQAYVSQQLRVLREAGMVTDRKDSLLVYYRVADPETKRLLETLLGSAERPTRLPTCPCPGCRGEAGGGLCESSSGSGE